MKPLTLKISGINSFMEEQTIDFSILTELGLFGIFGPTGSGKSTILDAITLALYGEIPRSGKDLSGVVNSHCDKGSIYYEFEIGSKENRRTYFVSRSFKRDKYGSVRSNGVKLCDITSTEEPLVLEEKVNAVNNRVAEIIGLKCNDFTRSVVLPQGNFSDFLKLSGREKRDMLERIFALQEYGSHLSQKIRGHKKKVEELYTFIEGRLKAYEGISQEGYESLLEEISIIQQQQQEAEKQFEKIEKEYEANKELWGLTQEYQGYIIQREKLAGQQETIGRYKLQYELAERAKNIQPYIEQQSTLGGQIKDLEIAKKENQSKLDTVLEILEKLREKWQVQQKRIEEDLPILVEEKSKMEFAREKKQKSQELYKEFKEVQQQEASLEKQLDQEKKKLETINESILTLQGNMKVDQKSMGELHISSQYRLKLYKANDVEKEHKRFSKEAQENTNKIEKLTSKEIIPRQKQKIDWQQQVIDLEKQSQEYTEEFERLNQEIKEGEQQNLAAVLAKELQEGGNCPVCGSQDHPIKADFFQGEEIEELEKKREELAKSMEQVKAQLEEKNKSLQQLTTEIALKEGFLQQYQEEAVRCKEAVHHSKIAYEQLREELGTQDIAKEIEGLQQRETRLEEVQKRFNEQQAKREKVEEQREKDQERYNQKSHQMIQIQQSQQALKKQIVEIKEEIKKQCGDKDPQKAVEELKNEISKIEKEYKLLKKEHEGRTEEKNQLEKKQKGIENTLEHLYKNHKEIEKTVTSMLQENDFDSIEQVSACFRSPEKRRELQDSIKKYEETLHSILENIQRLEKRMAGKSIEEEQWKGIQQEREEIKKRMAEGKKEDIEKQANAREMKRKLVELQKSLVEKKEVEHKKGLLEELERIFQGNRFVEFISLHQLRYIAREASQELKKITRGRYALELDVEGNFIMRDDFNGGVRRGTQTLSGGETFLTSLALALALSSHIQLKGKSPLEFFFLDEGFGTLDGGLLEIVMDSLEKLHSDRLSVGLISHVEELKQRIPRKLIVKSAVAGLNGSSVSLERG